MTHSDTRTLVGLMSGTSLDGVTAAVVRFSPDGERVNAELLGFTLHDYTPEQRTRLQNALNGATAAEYTRLNFDLGEWLARGAIAAIAESGV